MQRRRFLKAAGTVALAIPSANLLAGCGSGGSDGGGGTVTPSSGVLHSTSSVVNNHSHSVDIEVASFSNSPSEGLVKTSSNDLGHTHDLSLSEAELDAVEGGQVVTKESSLVNGHTHSFTLSQIAVTDNSGGSGSSSGYP